MKEETTSMDKKGVYSIQIASQSSLKVLYKKLHVLWLIFDEEGPGRGVPRLKNRPRRVEWLLTFPVICVVCRVTFSVTRM